MPDILAAALGQTALVWLMMAAGIAGIVRGFAGFGTAMVYMPVAGQILDPFSALVTLTIMDVFGPLPNIPRALREGNRRDVLRLSIGLALALPLGLGVLSRISVEGFRYGVSLASLVLLALLVSGWRYRGVLRRWMLYATGVLGGFLQGATGLSGPPVILLYMASQHAARVVRANLLLYLLLADILMMAMLWAMDRLLPEAVVLGALLCGPYLAGNVLGGWLFRPHFETPYRLVAYAIIAISALSGLPLFD